MTSTSAASGDDRLTSNDELTARLQAAATAERATRHTIGQSVTGRTIHALSFAAEPPQRDDATRVLLIGQQHGDEPAGAEALLDLIDDIASGERPLPGHVELWVVPRANPDGAATGSRRNANDADLNRDHAVLSQPETRSLHALARRVRPHLVVDCHEYRRDSGDYAEHGWTEWPAIMLDTANLTAWPDESYELGVRTCEALTSRLAADGVPAYRYLVGDAPDPQGVGEVRHSTLDLDDARNGLAAYGAMGFIIESGIYRNADDPLADLPERVAANRALLDGLLGERVLGACRAMAERMRATPAPTLIATNELWVRAGLEPRRVAVVEASSGAVKRVPAVNFADRRTVKSAVPTPAGYVIDAGAAEAFTALLDAHGLAFRRLDKPTSLRVEAVRLVRVEERYDPVYHRYDGLQVTEPEPVSPHEFAAGSLVIHLDALDPVDARRAALLLEPRRLFGLYQWPAYRGLVGPAPRSLLPVARLLPRNPAETPAASRPVRKVEP